MADYEPEAFVLSPDICDGYPSHGKNIGVFSSVPNTMMRNYDEHDNYPSFNKQFNEFKSKPKVMIGLYPDVLDGYPSFGIPISEEVLTEPYPNMMMSANIRYKNGYPTFRKSEKTFGAFENTVNLTEITIPKSVKRISDYAFWNSAIREVTIARDCKYSDHSFPEGCVIKYYD